MENSLVSPLNGKRYGEAYAENHNEVQQTIVRHALQRYLLDEKAVKQPNAHRIFAQENDKTCQHYVRHGLMHKCKHKAWHQQKQYLRIPRNHS